MKPKDLKPPYKWEDRRPVIEDGVFYVPLYFFSFEAYTFPFWEGIFPDAKPIVMEYCSGNGNWIVEKAKAHPECNWVAVEIRFDRARKIWSKIKNENLSNLFVVCGDAKTFTRYYVPSQSISEVFINFPDPWPKLKHAKNRLIKPEFLQEMSRALKKGGKVTFVTDDLRYLQETKECFEQSPFFTGVHLLEEIPFYGTSYFDSLWRQEGRKITYLVGENA